MKHVLNVLLTAQAFFIPAIYAMDQKIVFDRDRSWIELTDSALKFSDLSQKKLILYSDTTRSNEYFYKCCLLEAVDTTYKQIGCCLIAKTRFNASKNNKTVNLHFPNINIVATNKLESDVELKSVHPQELHWHERNLTTLEKITTSVILIALVASPIIHAIWTPQAS